MPGTLFDTQKSSLFRGMYRGFYNLFFTHIYTVTQHINGKITSITTKLSKITPPWPLARSSAADFVLYTLVSYGQVVTGKKADNSCGRLTGHLATAVCI
jgi:hypothetical protein